MDLCTFTDFLRDREGGERKRDREREREKERQKPDGV